MKISETIFSADGEALGIAEQNLKAGIVKFRPTDDHPKLSRMQWRRLADCRRDVLRYFDRRKKK